jgi:prepilin-type N-terminal cleavage/methylation domain-containing protein
VTLPLDQMPPRGERGLTLVEVLVALAVIGVALAGLAVVVPVSSYSVQEGQDLSTATFLAEQVLERARAAAWSESPAIDCLGLSSGNEAPVPAGATCHGATSTRFPDEASGIDGHPRFRRTVRVFDCASTTPCAGVMTTGMRRVEVGVAYTPLTSTGVAPSARTIRLEWLVARK